MARRVFGATFAQLEAHCDKPEQTFFLELIRILKQYVNVPHLFRKYSVDQPKLLAVKTAVDSGESVDLQQESPYFVSGVLILYLKLLPEPLFPFDMYDKCMGALATEGQMCEMFTALLRSLSGLRLHCTHAFLSYLCSVCTARFHSQTDDTALASMFGTRIFRKPDTVKHSIGTMGSIAYLLENYNVLVCPNGLPVKARGSGATTATASSDMGESSDDGDDAVGSDGNTAALVARIRTTLEHSLREVDDRLAQFLTQLEDPNADESVILNITKRLKAAQASLQQ